MATAPVGPGTTVTAEQLLALPDDGARHELVEGELHTRAPAGGEHGRTAATLLGEVYAVVRRDRLGEVFTAETGFVIRRSPDTVRAPDLAFVRGERAAEARVPGFALLVPDLIAEVVSPGDRASEVSRKALAWLDAGVRLAWVVDPENRAVTAYRHDGVAVLRGDDALDGGDVLPGFTLPLDELWA